MVGSHCVTVVLWGPHTCSSPSCSPWETETWLATTGADRQQSTRRERSADLAGYHGPQPSYHCFICISEPPVTQPDNWTPPAHPHTVRTVSTGFALLVQLDTYIELTSKAPVLKKDLDRKREKKFQAFRYYQYVWAWKYARYASDTFPDDGLSQSFIKCRSNVLLYLWEIKL